MDVKPVSNPLYVVYSIYVRTRASRRAIAIALVCIIILVDPNRGGSKQYRSQVRGCGSVYGAFNMARGPCELHYLYNPWDIPYPGTRNKGSTVNSL